MIERNIIREFSIIYGTPILNKAYPDLSAINATTNVQKNKINNDSNETMSFSLCIVKFSILYPQILSHTLQNITSSNLIKTFCN